MHNYDYNSVRSQAAIKQIKAHIRDKRSEGTTQGEIARALGMTITGVSRYINYMVGENIIHIAVPSVAKQRGHQPAIYKLGPAVRIMKRKPAFANDVLLVALFGRIK